MRTIPMEQPDDDSRGGCGHESGEGHWESFEEGPPAPQPDIPSGRDSTAMQVHLAAVLDHLEQLELRFTEDEPAR